MSALDTLADKAQAASERLARQGGVKAKLAGELAEDAEFLRRLKPELIRKRLKGESPTDRRPAKAAPVPAGPPPGEHPTEASNSKTPKQKRPSGTGPNPFLVVGAALVLGVVAAKVIDWRSHAHPRW